MAPSPRSYGSRPSSSSSRPGAGRASSGRGGGGGSRGGGGKGGNPAAVVIAIVAVVLVIGIVVLLSRRDKKVEGPPAPPPTASPAPIAGAAKPKEPELGPKPVLPKELIAKAQGLMTVFKEASDKGKALHEKAMEAKRAGDDQAWQDQMEQGREVMKQARDRWIEIEEEVVNFLDRNPSKGWTPDMVMDTYFKNESRTVQELLDKPLSGMAKTGRGH